MAKDSSFRPFGLEALLFVDLEEGKFEKVTLRLCYAPYSDHKMDFHYLFNDVICVRELVYCVVINSTFFSLLILEFTTQMSTIYSEIAKHEITSLGANGHHIFIFKNVEDSGNATYTIDSFQWFLFLQ